MTATAKRANIVEGHAKLERTLELGETLRHNNIVLNVVEALRPTARAKGFHLHAITARTRVGNDRHCYPDIVVSSEAVTEAQELEHPCFILEVSPRVSKIRQWASYFVDCLALESLERYVVVSATERTVTLHLRDPRGWRVEFLRDDGSFEIPCLETTLSLEQIYAGVTFEDTVQNGEP